ncbi:hypothetical protein BVRB_7g156520 [Beta vulgaris subsp. vulgaris]|nr:hypothetical protein BVRB_7g156520 [Beta vulgaris subsp. vulgaris]
MSTKLSIAKKIFSLEKDLILKSSSFQEFFSENEEWLKPYAAFYFLRDFFETSDHSQWGRFSHFSQEKLEKLVSEDSPHYSIICFHYYIQYHLHVQLSEAAEYARKKGVVLKGDLPIGVDRNSVDTWVYPNLFRMNTSIGAPPDYFDKNGQNWGFPTYNWEVKRQLWMVAWSFDSGLRDFTVLLLYSLASPNMCGFYVKSNVLCFISLVLDGEVFHNL